MERALCEYQVAMALYARQLWVEASKAQETAESILRETQRRAADGGL